jgi:hypothetical protein
MTNALFHIPAALPQPAQCYPFQPGDAVFYLPYPAGFCNKQQLIPAIVVKAQPAPVTTHRHAPRVIILPCNQPATATPPPDELTLRLFPIEHAGASQIARISFMKGCTWGEALHERNERHYGAFDALTKRHGMVGEMYRREGPWTEDDGQFHWFSAIMHWYADLGDEESFIAYYRAHAEDGLLPKERKNQLIALFERLLGDDQPGPSRRMVLPPLDIPRIADDSQPDGACDLTAWLDQQFGGAT